MNISKEKMDAAIKVGCEAWINNGVVFSSDPSFVTRSIIEAAIPYIAPAPEHVAWRERLDESRKWRYWDGKDDPREIHDHGGIYQPLYNAPVSVEKIRQLEQALLQDSEICKSLHESQQGPDTDYEFEAMARVYKDVAFRLQLLLGELPK